MAPKKKRFQRRPAERRYKKLFVIAAEGDKTESQYFAIFNSQNSIIKVDCLKGRHGSSPRHVLKRMKKYLKKERLRDSDEAWLVVDKDQWNNEQLTQLHEWSKEKDNYEFALSNPKFEYWLLLHFEDGTGNNSSNRCSERLKRHLPGYNKSIDKHNITQDMIDEAIRRAKARDNPPCTAWPRAIGSTTVYKLVENILQA